MKTEIPIDIIKKAILLEHRGKALYETVARDSKNDALKEIFSLLAREEVGHIEMLNKQFSRVTAGLDFDPLAVGPGPDAGPDLDQLLTDKIVAGIHGAGYEAAVISAALAFEKNAVSYYGEQAEMAGSEAVRSVFAWLTEWEKGHMQMLAKLDQEIKENIWYDNQFWPLD